jgi:hypothetical protein
MASENIGNIRGSGRRHPGDTSFRSCATERAVEGPEPHWRFAGADMFEVAAAEPVKR